MDQAAIPYHQQQAQVNAYFWSHAAFWKDIYGDASVQAEVYRDRLATTLAWIDSLALKPGSRVLDTGCGAGFLAVALAQRGFRVQAIDAAEAMVELSRRHAVESGTAERLSVQLGDVQALPFEDGAFDLVVALGVLPWLPRPELAMREMARVTRPNGYVLLTADNPARLITVLDPWNCPALAPLRGRVKVVLGRAGRLHPSHESTLRVPVTYHSPRQIDTALASAQLAKTRGMTLGFGPFKIRHRRLLPHSLGIAVHRWLQRLADRGVPVLRATGAQYLVLARKSAL